MPGLSDLAKPPHYVARVNRAIDHVTSHLDGALGLDAVAKVAGFSPFHFHRVFKAITGETLHDFVKRVRLDRAVQLIAHADPPSLTEVALACGFASSSDFSKAFKARFGVPPSAFDVEAHRESHRRAVLSTVPGAHRVSSLPVPENPDGFVVHVHALPPRRVAYLRVFKPYAGTGVLEAVQRLLAWADARGLADGQWLSWQWDDPELVPLDDCRYDVGVVVPEDARWDPDDGVGEWRFPALQVAEVAIEGPLDLELRAWEWLYRAWLPSSEFLPDQQPAFEAWVGRPLLLAGDHFELRLQLPVIVSEAVT